MDYVFQSIGNARRRYLLYTLQSKTEWSVTELATKVAAWETDTPEADVPQEDIDRMYVSLYHAHIPKLVDERVIEFDRERETIKPDEYAEQVLVALAGAGASLDSRQEIHARREMNDEESDIDADVDSGWRLVQQAHYDRAGRDDLTTIIAAVADAEGVSPPDITEPVLYDCVDIAALEDAFFGPSVAGERRDAVGSVEFQFAEYRIELKSDGWIAVYEPAD
ncbi:DUF7344 domain-containing protein [Haladaptatus sp. NG-WS-4]